MNSYFRLHSSALLIFLLTASMAFAAPVKIIFDTDMGNDVDDLMALCMIHNLQTRGACDLLAVTISKDNPEAAAFVDAVNTFYARPDVPIGVVTNGPTRDSGSFLTLADSTNQDGSFIYPHQLKSGHDAPEAVSLLRKLLAAQPDDSVTLVQTGFFTNTRRLLESPPDQYSPLNGRELVAKKIKLLSVMAGSFQPINGDPRYREYNVVQDLPSAQFVAANWPAPMVWSGFEIGIAAAFPHVVIERDLNYAPHHPLKEAYYRYNPPPHDRPTWDPTALLYAVFPERNYFDLSPSGSIAIDSDGVTQFHSSPQGNARDHYLIMNALQAARVREAIVQLCVEPPRVLNWN